MVRLDRINTGGGDGGLTSLGDGKRGPKHDARVEAYGTVDELTSFLGLVRAEGAPPELDAMLVQVQNDLFDLGSDLCVPGKDDDRGRLDAGYVARLDAWIEHGNAELAPLQSFLLPGGTPLAARLHVARAVCRRAERCVTACLGLDPERVNPHVLVYLNRLSDLLFVLARAANDGGKADVLWQPGQGRSPREEEQG